jgi:hypothetical protein
MSISKMILDTINKGTIEGFQNGAHAMMAWGASDFVGSDHPDNYGSAWVRFRVNGLKHKSWIRVVLMANGLYTVLAEDLHHKAGSTIVKDRKDSVHPANLAVIIDALVDGT